MGYGECEMKKQKVFVDGAVDNKRKKKYCSECNTWVSYSLYKKHKASHTEQGQAVWTPAPKSQLEIDYVRINNQLRTYQDKEHKERLKEEKTRKMMFVFGQLLQAIYED
jgi:hypothetical protein